VSVSQPLFACLDSLGIAHSTIEHAPVFTVDDGRDWKHEIPGLHCKNLFMKDAKGRIALAVLPGDKRANIKGIEKQAGLARLSFGKPDLLMEVLGVTPGSVTPFALINDVARRVTVILDADMMAADLVNYHPLRNDASTTIRAEDLLKFVKALGYAPLVFDCG
jgi:Ala-tRNA(Pro) deacylase